MMYTLICVYCHISAQIGLVITIHVEEFCFGFDEQENTACQLICCIKKKNFGILQCLPFSGKGKLAFLALFLSENSTTF